MPPARLGDPRSAASPWAPTPMDGRSVGAVPLTGRGPARVAAADGARRRRLGRHAALRGAAARPGGARNRTKMGRSAECAGAGAARMLGAGPRAAAAAVPTRPADPPERGRSEGHQGWTRSVGAAGASMTPGPVLPVPGPTATTGTECAWTPGHPAAHP